MSIPLLEAQVSAQYFVELALSIVRLNGIAAQVAPEALYNGANSTAIREALIT